MADGRIEIVDGDEHQSMVVALIPKRLAERMARVLS